MCSLVSIHHVKLVMRSGGPWADVNMATCVCGSVWGVCMFVCVCVCVVNMQSAVIDPPCTYHTGIPNLLVCYNNSKHMGIYLCIHLQIHILCICP